METETTGLVNNYRGERVTTHIISRYDDHKTACGRKIEDAVVADWIPGFFDGWVIEQGPIDEDYACKACLRSEEAPCEVKATSGETIYRHKMYFGKSGNGICTKCGKIGHW